jgi:hypothetical protein
MTYPYSMPKGGTTAPSPKPGPSLGRTPMLAWRQPIGGTTKAAPTPGK